MGWWRPPGKLPWLQQVGTLPAPVWPGSLCQRSASVALAAYLES